MRFKVRSYPMGFLSGAVDPQQLAMIINEAAHGGYRFKREEVTIEPRRVAMILRALALNIMFKWEPDEPAYEYKICTYRTRPLTRTVDVGKLTNTLNREVQGGFEVYFGFKEATRWLLFMPRETYFFVLRRRIDGANVERSYRFVEYAYRFFSQTMDAPAYEQVLNARGGDSRHIVSFRDERRVMGAFRQVVSITLFEDAAPALPAYAPPQLQAAGYPQHPSSYPPPPHSSYPPGPPQQMQPQQMQPQQMQYPPQPPPGWPPQRWPQ